jgi:integrase
MEKFKERFGKNIEEYESYKKAIEVLRKPTSTSYHLCLPNYFLFLDEDPDSVIANRRKDVSPGASMDDEERYDKKTHAYIQYLLNERKYSGRAAASVCGRIQGFFKNNNKRLGLNIKRIKYPKTRKVEKYSPSNEEVRHIFSKADNSRDRLITAIAYQTGPTPVDISKLRVGDLPREPWVYFEKSRSKTGEIWRAVTTPDIVYELKAYLKVKGIEENDKSKDKEPLFTGREGNFNNRSVSMVLTNLIVKAGLAGNDGFKPTSLRDSFEDALVEANINPKIKESLMGHANSIEQEYGGKNKLVINLVEAVKKVYPLIILNGHRIEGESNRLMQKVEVDVEKLKNENQELRERMMKLENISKPALETLLKRLDELEKQVKNN